MTSVDTYQYAFEPAVNFICTAAFKMCRVVFRQLSVQKWTTCSRSQTVTYTVWCKRDSFAIANDH